MTAFRAISAQLVDIRNVGTHKVVKLTLHAPEEHAMAIMRAFGWPTMVAPVPVALARLNENAAAEQPPRQDQSVGVPAGADKSAKSPAQIAGYLCTQIAFQKFLREQYRSQWLLNTVDGDPPENVAARTVRVLCNVESRADISEKNGDWSGLLLAYKLWQNHPELEDA